MLIFTHFKNMIGALKFKSGSHDLNKHILGWFVIPRLTLDIAYLLATFEDLA